MSRSVEYQYEGTRHKIQVTRDEWGQFLLEAFDIEENSITKSDMYPTLAAAMAAAYKLREEYEDQEQPRH